MSRHDTTTDTWQRIESIVSPTRGERRGRPTKDARIILNGVIWILRTRAPWLDLPRGFSPWQTVYKLFNSWSKSSLWQDVLLERSHEADLEAIHLDGTYVRAHQHSASAKWGAKPRPSDVVAAI